MMEPVLIVALAVGIDLAAGDPRNRYHPTAWIGRMIAWVATRARTGEPLSERLGGVALVALPCGAVLAALAAISLGIGLLGDGPAALILSVAASAILLKSTIAVREMERHAREVAGSVTGGSIGTARGRLATIVKRDTKHLDREHVISGAIESVSENTVDGVTGPLFYFGALGLPGALTYRVVNTADSMVGYRTSMFANLGWFAANCDSIINYVPARLTGLVMVLASALLGMDWRGSYRVMRRDGASTESRNAGYPMSAMAGALGVRLEKVDHYRIGDGVGETGAGHILEAIRLMKVTVLLFCGAVTAPLAVLLWHLGWWIRV